MFVVNLYSFLRQFILFLILALFKTCHEIKLAGQEKNANWGGRFGIDPDGPEGVDPFAVDCDFTTNPEIGITEVSNYA